MEYGHDEDDAPILSITYRVEVLRGKIEQSPRREIARQRRVTVLIGKKTLSGWTMLSLKHSTTQSEATYAVTTCLLPISRTWLRRAPRDVLLLPTPDISGIELGPCMLLEHVFATTPFT